MNAIKYPKTMHFPFSEGLQNDDRMLSSMNGFVGKKIIVTEKMDGENTSLYSDHFHARSLDSRHHESRDWVKSFWGTFNYKIPDGWRVCGENLYATHSIHYENLKSYFVGFSVWNEENTAISWDETLLWFEEFGIDTPKVLYEGKFDLDYLKKLSKTLDTKVSEGFVVRIADEIKFEDFEKYVGKWVRKGHVQTDEHWMNKPVVPNKLANHHKQKFSV